MNSLISKTSLAVALLAGVSLATPAHALRLLNGNTLNGTELTGGTEVRGFEMVTVALPTAPASAIQDSVTTRQMIEAGVKSSLPMAVCSRHPDDC